MKITAKIVEANEQHFDIGHTVQFYNSQTNQLLITVKEPFTTLAATSCNQQVDNTIHNINLSNEIIILSINEIESQVGALTELEKQFVTDYIKSFLHRSINS